MRFDDKKIELADTVETERREREVTILINVVEPDPEYQPIFVSDEASFFDITEKREKEIKGRLEFYLKRPIPSPLTTPLWQFVDCIKQICPGWPEDWPGDN